MGKIYTVNFTGVAVTAQQDLFEITAASNRFLWVHALSLSQSTEVGDAQEEGLSVLVRRGVSSTSGSGGTAFTPVTLETNQGAAGFTAEVNNTTKMSVGTITTLVPFNWNVRMPFEWIPTPEIRPLVNPSERLTVELATTPADSITMSGCMWLEEVG